MFKVGSAIIVTGLVLLTIGKTIVDATLRQAVRKTVSR